MATGLAIRDFTKQYRELRYADSGSIRLTEIEHNAYLQRLTIEITHYDAPRASNFKTLPENTHWGYCTAFKGSSVVFSTPVKFAKQRVFELVNQSIWDYHQATESTVINRAVVESGTNAVIQSGILQNAASKLVRILVNAKDSVTQSINKATEWLIGYQYFSGSIPTTANDAYKAFPIASPFPDVFKFKSDIPASFLLRLETWYLVNPAVYILDNPTDTSDETEGEDEYPTPEQGDGDGDGGEFPTNDQPEDGSDPRDYGPGNRGEAGTWTFSVNYFDAGNNPPCNNVPDGQFGIRGFKKERIRVEYRGAVNQWGAREMWVITSAAQIRVAQTCGGNLTGLPTFISDPPQ